jgi:hypothetical protein
MDYSLLLGVHNLDKAAREKVRCFLTSHLYICNFFRKAITSVAVKYPFE